VINIKEVISHKSLQSLEAWGLYGECVGRVLVNILGIFWGQFWEIFGKYVGDCFWEDFDNYVKNSAGDCSHVSE
jgi:hypothetical protein